MLERLSFTTRIMLLPALAALAFLALVATTYLFDTQISRQLDEVEQGLYPSLVLALKIEGHVKDIQFQLNGAVASESLDFVEEADRMRDQVIEQLTAPTDSGRSTIDETILPIAELRAQFDAYYAAARATTLQMIGAETGTALDPQVMVDRFNGLIERLGQQDERNRSEMNQAFSTTRDRKKNALFVNMMVSLLSLSGLGWVTYRTLRNVRTLTEEITGSATQINSSSSQVLVTSRQHEKNANQHASAIEETRITIHSLTEASRSIAKLAEAVLENAQQTLRTNQEIAERNSHLTRHLEGISAILESVKDIANKSELLALNAALEGTKAGEAGRGFSLVAAQMQRLAENVMDNVRDIKRLTKDVHDASQSAVLAIVEGAKLAEQTTHSARQIRLVTQQQESAAEQVTVSMNDASVQVQQSVAAVRESTQAMESLVQLASQLNELLMELKLMDTNGLPKAKSQPVAASPSFSQTGPQVSSVPDSQPAPADGLRPSSADGLRPSSADGLRPSSAGGDGRGLSIREQ